MANNENLILFSQRSEKEVREMNKKGGINSGIARKKKKILKDELLTLLDVKISDENGKKATIRKKIAFALIEKALNGDVKAFEVIRDTIGEKPTDKTEQVNQTPSIVVATQEQADLIKQIMNVRLH